MCNSRPATPDPRPKGRHGGRRPGAGAPRGNLNGLKHGLRSKQLRQLADRWARDPEMRDILASFARYAAAQHRAAMAVALWLRYTGLAGDGTSWQGPPPEPLTQKELNLFAQTLAKRAIKKMKKDRTWRGP